MPDGGRFVAGTAVHFRRGFRAEIAGGGSVTIGDLCVFSYYSLIQCSTSVEIGDRAMFGQSSMVVDGNHKFRHVSEPLVAQGFEFRPIRIAADVTTLTKVTVINDIGTKSVVGANSVVNKPVPPYCMVAGVPARIVDYFGPPELEPPEWRERLLDRGEPAPPSRPNRLEVCGHSIAFGGGVSSFEHRFSTKLAELLDAAEINRAVAGAIACWQESSSDPGDGGYAHVLQHCTRPAEIGSSHPDGAFALVYFGLNDLAALGPSELEPFQHALRTIISRHRAASVFEESHESVTYSESWAARPADGPDCSGSGTIETQTDGATLDITVPERFPGGTVALGFLMRVGAGALHTFTVDGEPAGQLDTRRAGDPLGHRTGAVARLCGLAPGSHVIGCRVSGVLGATAFDYWQVEPEPAPPVLAPLAYALEEWSLYKSWPHPPTAAAVARLNVAIGQVAAEFGSGVVLVETEAVMREPSMFSSGGVYPDDAGHAALARACATALSRAGGPAQRTAQAAASTSVTAALKADSV
jgi:acetyltransferase-like isoleucine patch superfamily enzyme